MKTEPCGYLPMREKPQPGDKLIFIPVYVIPVEMLERNLMAPPRYLFQVVIVDGYNGKTTCVDEKAVTLDMDFVPDAEEMEYLDLKISLSVAKELAECGAVPSDYRSWKRVIKNRNVMVTEGSIKVAWRVYAVRGNELLDTFTGETIKSAGLAGMLFS